MTIPPHNPLLPSPANFSTINLYRTNAADVLFGDFVSVYHLLAAVGIVYIRSVMREYHWRSAVDCLRGASDEALGSGSI